MIKEIGDLALLLEKYGPIIIILSIFLVIFISLFIFMINTVKKYIETTQSMNAQLVTSLLNEHFSKDNDINMEESNKSYDEKNIVNIYMKLNKSLKNACESILLKTSSNRTAIYVFHNGAQASHGLPFFKMSCISEKVSRDSKANIKMAEHSSMPLSLFDNIVSSLYDNNEYRIIRTQTTDPGDLIFIKHTKLQDCFFVPIFDDDDNMMGFIFNGYNKYDNNKDIEKEKEYLEDLATMAKPVIEFSKFQEYNSRKGVIDDEA